jgi:hypothetical protein
MKTLTTSSLLFVRPADVTAYAALDVVANATSSPQLFQLESIVERNESSGYIVFAKLYTDQLANTARFRVHLFKDVIVPINDNSPFVLAFNDREKYIGNLDFPAMRTEGAGSNCAYSVLDNILKFIKVEEINNLYTIFETLDAFTPDSAQKFYLEISVEKIR